MLVFGVSLTHLCLAGFASKHSMKLFPKGSVVVSIGCYVV